MRRAPDHVVAEHGALLRHWAGLQARVSEQMCAQDRRCAALEQELMRWRARWMVATTQMLWGLGWPKLTPVSAHAETRADDDVQTAMDVICQVGCASQAHPWRSDAGLCRRSGDDCMRVPPKEQGDLAGASARTRSVAGD